MKFLNILCIALFILSMGVCRTHSKLSAEKKQNIESQYNLLSGADIKAMVQVQIDSARARDYRGEIKSCTNYIGSSPNIVYSSKEKVVVETEPFLNLNPKFYIIIGFSGLVFLIVFIRRKIFTHQNEPQEEIVEKNISLSQNDKIVNTDNPDLDQIRNKLVNPSVPGIKEGSISRKAKGMKIAKGEVILAAKIKSYQLAHFGNK